MIPNRFNENLASMVARLGIKVETLPKGQKDKKASADNTALGYVYFMGSASLPDRIKIGFARDPVQRRLGLETGSPVDLMLLAIMPGTKESETYVQKLFKKYCLKGEWFSAVPEIWDFINRIRFNPDIIRHFGNPDCLRYMLVERNEIIDILGKEVYWKLKERVEK